MVTCVIRIAVVTVLQRNVPEKVEPALMAVQETGKGIDVTTLRNNLVSKIIFRRRKLEQEWGLSCF